MSADIKVTICSFIVHPLMYEYLYLKLCGMSDNVKMVLFCVMSADIKVTLFKVMWFVY